MLPSYLRVLFLGFFISHIPTTLLIDGQAVIGSCYPQVLKDVLQWHISTNQDFLMRDLELWFRCVVWGELVLQLPFFFVASYAFYKGCNWIRIPSIIYGSHVATTMIPILGEIIFSPKWSAASGQANLLLFGIYFPYLAIPFLMVVTMALDPEPFGPQGWGKIEAKVR
ncbi:unnamed protein product [Heterosigma akashiwo]|mmetsp:Transcript_40634/g.59882  ORF Transcript_40634/g.59882 Transcript_40634/m.59882 type:complete len:168 (+) Transcript_40634:217-720(+)